MQAGDDAGPSPWRGLFPIVDECLFFDHAGVAPISRRVVEAGRQFLDEAARDLRLRYPYWEERAEQVRAACGRLVGCESRRVAFVKNTSEALSFVAAGLDWRPGDAVIVADREFPSNVYPWWALERQGVETRMIPAGDRGPLVEDVARLLDERVRVVALSAVAYGTGDRLDLSGVATLCRDHGALFVVDGAQAIGAIPIDLDGAGLDLVAADGHKWLCAPEGCGFLATSERLLEGLRPSQYGWKSVVSHGSFHPYEFRLRSDAAKLEAGSLPFLGIHALGAAIDLALEVGSARIESRLVGLVDRIRQGLQRRGLAALGWARDVDPGPAGAVDAPARAPGRGPAAAAAGIVTFVPPGNPERFRQELWGRGVVAKVRFGGIRLAPHYYQQTDDVDRLLEGIDAVCASEVGR